MPMFKYIGKTRWSIHTHGRTLHFTPGGLVRLDHDDEIEEFMKTGMFEPVEVEEKKPEPAPVNNNNKSQSKKKNGGRRK